MTTFGAAKARQVLAAPLRIDWSIKRQRGTSHRTLAREGWPDYVFSFHDQEEICPKCSRVSPSIRGSSLMISDRVA